MMSSVFILLMSGMIAAHLYGLQSVTRTQVKLSAADDARKAISMLIQDIRSANSLAIGSGDSTSFTMVADGAKQSGSVLQVFPTTATNQWVRYFYDSTKNTLSRLTHLGDTSLVTINNITNDFAIFQAEDSSGNVLTNRTPSPVIEVNLSFTKLKNPQVSIGPGNYFDFYQLNTRISPRMHP